MSEGRQGRQREVLGRVCGRGGLPSCVCFGGQVVPGAHFEKQGSMPWIGPCFPLPSENGHLYPYFPCLLSISPLDIKLHQVWDYMLSLQHLSHCQAQTDQASEISDRGTLKTIL